MSSARLFLRARRIVVFHAVSHMRLKLFALTLIVVATVTEILLSRDKAAADPLTFPSLA